MDQDRTPTYVHKVSDVMLLDSKEDYYSGFASKHQIVPYKKLVVPSAMRSIYWKCYGFPASENNEILTRNKIVCLLCKAQMIYNRNTSNLRMHLQNKHRMELESLELAQPMPSCKSGRTDRRSARRGCKVRKKTFEPIEICPADDESMEITQQFADETSFPHYFNELEEATFHVSQTVDEKYIPDTISEFITTDLQSPDIVDGKGFRRLINILKPSCEIPSKAVLIDEYIPKIYESLKDQLKPEIASISSKLSLSVEDWVASSGETYSTVSVHYAQTDDCELQTRILSSIYCSDLDPLHWGVQFDTMMEEWKLKLSYIKAVIVSSDREDVYNSLRDRLFTIIPCLGHTIQRACMTGCFLRPEVGLIVKKCRSFIALIYLIPRCTAYLKELESSIECEKDGLQLDTSPLWSSTFNMLKQILVRKDILLKIFIYLSNLGYAVDKLHLDNKEWDIITDISVVLSPFKVAMNTLYEEKIPLISILKPLLNRMKNVHLHKKDLDSQYSRDLKSNLWALILDKYKDPTIEEILSMSCALDPRFKNLPLVNDRIRDHIKEKLKEMIDNFKVEDIYNNSCSTPNKRLRLSGMESLLGDLCMKNDVPSSQRFQLEYVQFECEEHISFDKSPIEFWKNTRGKCPNISKLALQNLCIPVCVNNYLNSHFNFKTSNLILTPQIVHKLRFIHQNNVMI